MKNVGLFSSLFLEQLKAGSSLDDAAKGRMATLAHSLLVYRAGSTGSLWESFLKQAVSYLEFVPPAKPDETGVYPLYDDFGYRDCVAVLYLAPDGEQLDLPEVGRFYPAKLVRELRKRSLSWGILTNGSMWRLYSIKTSRPYEDFVELDLSSTLAASNESEYGLFERFFHKDSFLSTKKGKDDKEIPTCRLDGDRSESETVLDAKVKKPFLSQVDEVLQYICNGFIYDTRKSGAEYTEEERKEIFASAVKLIYRSLFLFYAEARRLLPSDPEKADLYRRHSIRTLCEEARRFRWGERQDTDQYDLWQNLKGLTSAVNDGDPEYGIMGYNGGLFDDEEERFLRDHRLRNDFLARALYLLAYVEPYDNEKRNEYPIPYEDLEVRHLGELYENILEFTVVLSDADRIRRRTKKGVEVVLASGIQRQAGDSFIKKGEVYFGESALERKQTGSYYTPESLVRFLNQKSIAAPLNERFEQGYRKRFDDFIGEARTGLDQGSRRGAAESAAALVNRFAEEELLHYSVCDPAMGSGHFLVDASNQMTGVVISLLAEIPCIDGMKAAVSNSPNVWRRRITRHCLYGVDLNLLAVNLAKLSLWLNCFASEHKLTFLDHHLRCGNSLIGIRDLGELRRIPKRKTDGRKEKGSALFDMGDLSTALKAAAGGVAGIASMDEDDTDRQRAALHGAEETLARTQPLANLFTAYLMNPEIATDEYRELFILLAKGEDPASSFNLGSPQTMNAVKKLSNRHDFFHWPLEFPEMFGLESKGGFNATVGNPPWDTWSPKMQEFFVRYDQEFRELTNAEAKRRVASLCKEESINKAWQDYQFKFYEAANFFQNHLDYSHQNIMPPGSNLYKLFLERDYNCLCEDGLLGVILPSGIYTDAATKDIREFLIQENAIESLYCFENRNPVVFQGVDNRFKFVTICLCRNGKLPHFKGAFMQHDPQQLPIIERRALTISFRDIVKFSPDSYSVTEFNNQNDIDIARKIYGEYPLLGDLSPLLPWTLPLLSVEFNMTHQSHLFGNDENGYALYEGKMIGQFDHQLSQNRWTISKEQANEYLASKEMNRIGKNTKMGELAKQYPDRVPMSFLEYRFGVRAIAASTNERALISTILPQHVCTGNSLFTSLPWNYSNKSKSPVMGNSEWFKRNYSYVNLCSTVGIINSFIYDWLIRMKISTNLNVYILNQLPLPRQLDESFEQQIVARVSRLVCFDTHYKGLWSSIFASVFSDDYFWYDPAVPIDDYGPAHEQEIRRQLRDEVTTLTAEWGPHCGVHNRLPDRRDTGDRAQLRAEIDAYVAHLYGLSRDDFSYILDTFPVLKSKEKKAFGEFMSKRKCLEEFDRIGKVLGK